MNNYILDADGNPVLEPDILAWAAWMEDEDARRVARTEVGNAEVSTVFLAMSYGRGGRPVLYETMVFGGHFDGEQERYYTRAEAEEGHKAMVSRIQNYKGTSL